jgi:NNP family nitrate/nitrite transporter-like MFS transporter
MAIISMIGFALFLKMANGATYAITPFINKDNVGLVSGIVGAGGNLGGMLFGFLFKSSTIAYWEAFQYIGMVAIAVSLLVFLTRFGTRAKTQVMTTSLEAVA